MGAMLFALPFFGRGERMEEKIIGTFIAHLLRLKMLMVL